MSRSPFHLRSLLLAAGLALAAFGAVHASDHPKHDPAARLAERLALDDTQKASVSAIFERHRPAHEALRERMRKQHDAAKALNPKGANYSAQSQALADAAGTLARDQFLERAQMKSDLSAVLTEEQMRKFDEMGPRGPREGRGHFRHKGPADDK